MAARLKCPACGDTQIAVEPIRVMRSGDEGLVVDYVRCPACRYQARSGSYDLMKHSGRGKPSLIEVLQTDASYQARFCRHCGGVDP